MTRIRNIAAVVTALIALVATSEHAQAQERPRTDPRPRATSPDATLEGASIMMKVDGLSCPFCAYGLEKRLKDTAGPVLDVWDTPELGLERPMHLSLDPRERLLLAEVPLRSGHRPERRRAGYPAHR